MSTTFVYFNSTVTINWTGLKSIRTFLVPIYSHSHLTNFVPEHVWRWRRASHHPYENVACYATNPRITPLLGHSLTYIRTVRVLSRSMVQSEFLVGILDVTVLNVLES